MNKDAFDQIDGDEKVFHQNIVIRFISSIPQVLVLMFIAYFLSDWTKGDLPDHLLLLVLLIFVPFVVGYYFANDSWQSIIINSEGVTKRRYFRDNLVPWSAITSYAYVESDRLHEGFFGLIGFILPLPTPSTPRISKTVEALKKPSLRYRSELALFDENDENCGQFIGIEWAFYSEILNCLREKGVYSIELA